MCIGNAEIKPIQAPRAGDRCLRNTENPRSGGFGSEERQKIMGESSGVGADGEDHGFRDLFKGMLAFFLLEMGLVAASRLADLRRTGPFLLAFATVMPLCAGLLGIVTAKELGLSVGGAVLLATLYASASYIAAPAAMRIAVPEANPALSIGAALGITFPFNLLVGIPLYHWLAVKLQGVA